MAITSPFKKFSHSRENSREERKRQSGQSPSVQQGGAQSPQRAAALGQLGLSLPEPGPEGYIMKPMVAQMPLPHQAPVKSGANGGGANGGGALKSNRSSAGSTGAMNLAQQYESDKQGLIKYCFSSYDSDGVLVDSYITHVRVVEDSGYPSSRPPASSPQSSKKQRVLALAVKKDGTVYLHKGRENSNGSFQIGRTWSLNDLYSLERELHNDVGFTAVLGKSYYWETQSSRERQVFITSLVRVYRKFKNGFVPKLINWDLKLFGLDDASYKLFLNKDLPTPNSESPVKLQQTPKQVQSSPKKLQEQGSTPVPQTSPQRSPERQRQQEKETRNVPVPLVIPDAPPSRATTKTGLQAPPVVVPVVPVIQAAAPSSASSSTLQQTPISQLKEAKQPGLLPNVADVNSDGNSQEQRSLVDEDLAAKVESMKINDIDSVIQDGGKGQLQHEEVDDDLLKPIEKSQSNTSDVSQCIQSINMVAHAKTREEFEQEEARNEAEEATEADDSDSGDIADLYAGDDDNQEQDQLQQYEQEPMQDSVSPLKIRNAQQETPIVITPPEQEDLSYDNSDDHSFDQTYHSHEVLNNIPEEPFPGAEEVSLRGEANAKPADQLKVSTETKESRQRSATMNSLMEAQPENLNNAMADVFDEIYWDSNDDSETLTAKLVKELALTEYEMTKALLEVKSKSGGLVQTASNIASQCKKISPLFNFYSVELSGFVNDIKDIELESNGLQVETVNKKHLQHELRKLFNIVSVDDSSLKVLASGDLDRDLYSLEGTLSDLESALNAIRGGDNNEDNLGEMHALTERRSKYEYATEQFMRRVTSELDSRFRYIVTEMGKYDSTHDVTFKDALSEMLVYSGLTLFVRNNSEPTYFGIIGSWEGYANTFYQRVLSQLSESLVESAYNKHKYSLIDDSSDGTSSLFSSRKRSSTLQSNTPTPTHEKLREKFAMLDSSSAASIPRYSSDRNGEVEKLINTVQALEKHLLLLQDFTVKFFHMSNENHDLAAYMKAYPISERPSLLTSSVSEIDSNRENVRDIYNVLNTLLQPGVQALLRNFKHCLRSDMRNSPPFLLYLELFDKRFSSTNQEYMVGIFNRLRNKVQSDWENFVTYECKSIDKYMTAKVRREGVSAAVKNFCQLVIDNEQECERIISTSRYQTVSYSELDTKKVIEQSYKMFCATIVRNMNSATRGEKILKIRDGGELKKFRTLLTNDLQNCNWIIESLGPMKVNGLQESLDVVNDMFKDASEQYVSEMVSQYFGKISSFVYEVDAISKEYTNKVIDPSKRVVYNKDEINKLLSNFTTKDITMIVNNMRKDVEQQLYDSERSEIQTALVDNMWSSLQGEFVSVTMKLTDIINRFYRDLELRFTKKDVIAAFSAAKQ